MKTITQHLPIKEWVSTNFTRVEVIAEYNPNEEQDPWVEFENIDTRQRYTCRKEAFLARYTPRVN